ncbi:MAG: hypothetical protein BGO80_11065 [Devosia sp. 63-57]|nr:MAG: hypothetical protein ABS74_18785 [Pelagibacterium sp. SCN 63-126]ODU84257.1 MAG: hypothetical protein ABT14_14505 [Pelagibacterium sp. SCN 63-17]OJX42076.1 MAG: hypothetical protein BGO80_11065 [Devosia sp. 63-57]
MNSLPFLDKRLLNAVAPEAWATQKRRIPGSAMGVVDHLVNLVTVMRAFHRIGRLFREPFGGLTARDWT